MIEENSANNVVPMRDNNIAVNDLLQLINSISETNLTLIEIGSYAGESTEIFAKSGKFKLIVCIDPWKNGYDDNDAASNSDMQKVEKLFDERTSKFSFVIKHKGTLDTFIVSPLFNWLKDKVDLVYIDGLHTYEGCKHDIEICQKFIKPKVAFSGHDYTSDVQYLLGVKTAVDEIFGFPDKTFCMSSWLKYCGETNEIMNLMLASTPDYVIHAFETIFSIRQHSRKKLNVILLIYDDNVQQIQKFISQYQLPNVTFNIFACKQQLDKLIDKSYSMDLTAAAYLRILALDIFKDNKERILYIDTDIIAVLDGIDELYSMQFDGKCIIACREVSVEVFDKVELNHCKVKNYFNSGVLLIDLNAMKQHGYIDKCIDALKNPPEFIHGRNLHDQSILNMCLEENVQFVNPKYNVQAILMGYPCYDEYAKTFGYANQVDLIQHCVLMHLQGTKPWEERWNTWQSYQLPMKKWMETYYLINKMNLMKYFPTIYDDFNKLIQK